MSGQAAFPCNIYHDIVELNSWMFECLPQGGTVMTAVIAHSMGKLVEDGSRECWKITWYTNVSEAGLHCDSSHRFRTQAATVFATVIATVV
jgi:hypothetical protein